MDLRHGFGQAWRRSSPTPACVRTCTPATPAAHFLRRLTPRRRPVKQCLTAGCAVAVDNIPQPSASEALFFPVHDEDISQGSCLVDAPCPAVLQTRLSKAHSSAASAALVVQDTADEKLVATASLDKGMAIWRFYSSHTECESVDGSCEESIEVTRLRVPGAPVFSLAKIPEVLPDGTILRKRPKPPGIYLGTAAKEVLTWMLGSKDVTDKVVLGGHTGWVRSLAVTGKWLFSCGCNCLRLWDTTFRTPKECESVRLFTGDILAIAASDGRVCTAGADGSLRSWAISRAGDLQEGPSREKAHDGRVSACVTAGSRVFTVSYDGSVKAWDIDSLELVAEVKGAHNGEKIFCVTVGSNGVVFTGGDDKLIRAWDKDLNPIGAPLEGHSAAVRVLSAGNRALLVSGDAEGDVCIWETYPVNVPSAASPTSQPVMPAELGQSPDFVAASSAAATEAGAAAPQGGAADAVAAELGAAQQLDGVLPAPAQLCEEVAGAITNADRAPDADASVPEQQQQQQHVHAAEEAAAVLLCESPPAAPALEAVSVLGVHEPQHQSQPNQERHPVYAPVESLGFFDEQHQRIYAPEGAWDTMDEQQEPLQPLLRVHAPGSSSGPVQQHHDHPAEQPLGGVLDEQQQRNYASETATEPVDAEQTQSQLGPAHGLSLPVSAASRATGADLSAAEPHGCNPHEPAAELGASADGQHGSRRLTGACGDHAQCSSFGGEQMAAAPAVNANGSGGFAVLAVTVSEDTAEDSEDLRRAAAASLPRHIEVESVASAVAAACLAKDVAAPSMTFHR